MSAVTGPGGLSGVTAANGPVAAPTLDQAAFLRLMTAQLNAQDPFKPMDQSQMVAQMAQFSQVAGIGEMNRKLGDLSAISASLAAISDQLSAQTTLLQQLAAPAAIDPSTTATGV